MRILYVISFFSMISLPMNNDRLYRYFACLGTLDKITIIGYRFTGNRDEISWDKTTDTYSGLSYQQQEWHELRARSVLGLPDKGLMILSEDEAKTIFIAMKEQQKRSRVECSKRIKA